MKILLMGFFTCIVALSWGPFAPASVQVDVELSLLVDVSLSISDAEFILQKDGYVAAFNDAAVVGAITSGTFGQIAVNMIYWSGAGEQEEVVPWTLISDAITASAFASAIDSTTRDFSSATAIGEAISFAWPLFASNGFDGTSQVIDISGNGVTNDGIAADVARDAALAAGIDTINGLVIGESVSVLTHYQNDVVGGANPFVLWAKSLDDFDAAIEAKLIAEVDPSEPIPEPASLAIWSAVGGLGLVALGRRRRRSA